MTALAALLAVLLLAPARGRSPAAPKVVDDRPALPRLVALGIALVAGLVAAKAVGPVGFLAAVPLVVLLPRRLEPLLSPERSAPVDPLRAALALDLLAAGLDAGLPPASAARVTADVLVADPELATLLQRAGSALALGVPPAAAWAVLEAEAVLVPSARALARADASGTRVSPTLRRQADAARDRSSAVRQARAQRLAVTTTIPLGLCFLPAFLLLGVAPVALTLLGRLR